MTKMLLYLADCPDPGLLRGLAEQGWQVRSAPLKQARASLARGGCRFILLDLARACPILLHQCQAASAGAQVLVLLQEAEPSERARVLRNGADLCLSRPVAFVELHARLQALTREPPRPAAAAGEPRLWLSPTRLLVGRGNRRRSVTVSEQRLLAILARHPGAVSRDLIEQQLWGTTQISRSALIERHVCNLRRKLAELDAPDALQTLRGYGYGLRETMHLRMD
jgi:DNA-binding response OmpR family regulator